MLLQSQGAWLLKSRSQTFVVMVNLIACMNLKVRDAKLTNVQQTVFAMHANNSSIFETVRLYAAVYMECAQRIM